MLQSHLLNTTVPLKRGERLLVLNSANDSLVHHAASQGVHVVLAEDNYAAFNELQSFGLQATAFHDYILHSPGTNMDVAALNLLYQPSNQWIRYALDVAHHALREGGQLYVTGAKERGILSAAKRMQERFGNVETLLISKGQRVVRAVKRAGMGEKSPEPQDLSLSVFANSKLDEGTRQLLAALEVKHTDEALDLGCGAGYIGLAIARQAPQGHVTMVDSSLVAVAASQHAITASELSNISVLPSDGVHAVKTRQFDLVATNPPFHQGGIQTTTIAEQFIREAAQVLRSDGRFYLVANRFLKYEPTLQSSFQQVGEVAGDTRYKVLLASRPNKQG